VWGARGAVVDPGKAIVLRFEGEHVIAKVKTRLASEQGFTLIELLVVMIILGILVAIAVPAYLSFTSKAKTAAAESNVRSAIPAAESYYQETTVGTFKTNSPNSYTGMVGTALRTEAPGVAPNVKAVALNSGNAYCVEDTESSSGGTTYDYIGGDTTGMTLTGTPATIEQGTCLAEAGTAAS
jgi:type IV pilus assembly protein PilA